MPLQRMTAGRQGRTQGRKLSEAALREEIPVRQKTGREFETAKPMDKTSWIQERESKMNNYQQEIMNELRKQSKEGKDVSGQLQQLSGTERTEAQDKKLAQKVDKISDNVDVLMQMVESVRIENEVLRGSIKKTKIVAIIAIALAIVAIVVTLTESMSSLAGMMP